MGEEIAYRNILVPTDGSDAVAASTAHALRIGAHESARIHAIYVVDRRITMSAGADSRAALIESLRADGEAAVQDVVDAVEERGLECEQVIRDGTPAKEILEYAEENAIDLIVIGSSGKSPREKLMDMGSVSERVVDNASQPVLVVRARTA